MSIFKSKSKPDLQGRRNDLQTRLQNAETTLGQLRAEAVALTSDDPGKLSGHAEAAWRAEFEINALRTAIQQAEAEITIAEEAERAKANRAEREATARIANGMADGIEKAFLPFPGTIQAMLAAVEAAEPIIGKTGMPDFLRNLGHDIPVAAETLIAAARARAEQTLAGSAPASLPKPFLPEIVPEPEPSPTLQVFSLERLSWRDERGQRQSCGAFGYHALPVKAAKVALARNLALEPGSPRVQEILGNKHGLPHLVDAQKSYDLDRDPGTVEVYREW